MKLRLGPPGVAEAGSSFALPSHRQANLVQVEICVWVGVGRLTNVLAIGATEGSRGSRISDLSRAAPESQALLFKGVDPR